MTAQDAFIASIEQSRNLLEQLQAKLDSFLDVDPDAVNWGNVGDANRIKTALQEIMGDES